MSEDSSVLLTTRGSLARFGIFSIEMFECLSQVNPSGFEGVPLSDQEFVFGVPLDATRDVAKSQVKCLSKSEGVEYPNKIFLFDLATFTGGKVGVQGDR